MNNSKYKLGFLGGGNMANAIIGGLIECGTVQPSEIFAYDVSQQACEKTAAAYGVDASTDPSSLADADMVILAVKPFILPAAIKECGRYLGGKGVISIIAGTPVEKLAAFLPGCRILRVMPNVAALCGQAATLACNNTTLEGDERAFAEKILCAIGKPYWIDESLLDAACGISGCGPAYVFMMIEAMADAGVLHGVPRNLALELAAQTLKGAAQLALESSLHPEALKDMVCSPKGSTIDGVIALEDGGFRSAVIAAVDSAARKGMRMSQETQ